MLLTSACTLKNMHFESVSWRQRLIPQHSRATVTFLQEQDQKLPPSHNLLQSNIKCAVHSSWLPVLQSIWGQIARRAHTGMHEHVSYHRHSHHPWPSKLLNQAHLHFCQPSLLGLYDCQLADNPWNLPCVPFWSRLCISLIALEVNMRMQYMHSLLTQHCLHLKKYNVAFCHEGKLPQQWQFWHLQILWLFWERSESWCLLHQTLRTHVTCEILLLKSFSKCLCSCS